MFVFSRVLSPLSLALSCALFDIIIGSSISLRSTPLLCLPIIIVPQPNTRSPCTHSNSPTELMARAAVSPASIHRTRIRSPSPSHTPSPPPAGRTRQSTRLVRPGTKRRSSSSSQSKENEPASTSMSGSGSGSMENLKSPVKLANGRAPTSEGRTLRDGSIESDGGASASGSTIRARRAPQTQASPYNGLPTLPTIGDDDDIFLSSGPSSPTSPGRAPPPAPSAQAAADPKYGQLAGSGVRRRRASSIKRKLSPGVTPTKVVDWEIPRKVFHSSIGTYQLPYRIPYPLRIGVADC